VPSGALRGTKEYISGMRAMPAGMPQRRPPRSCMPSKERQPFVEEAFGLGNRRLQIGRSVPFFTAFLPHTLAMGMQIRQKLSSLRPIFAFDAPSSTAS
jgi:hypothetical protein